MNMEALVDLAGTGATWILYSLIALSAIQLALILERSIVFYRSRAPGDLRQRVRDALATGNMKAVLLTLTGGRSLQARVLTSGVTNYDRGVDATEELMRSTMIEEKQELERGLSFLGTLGNNAPFIGLFGTVLGIIHAMADMSSSAGGQASRAVMAGISEALISTAVGLMVALPAVAAFNFFQRKIKTRAAAAEALGGELLAQLKSPAISLRATNPERPALRQATSGKAA
jgi:biopolymer transport protein ExbB